MKEILLIVWLVSNFRRQLLLIYWWQVKEYRFDRFWVFLKTREGQNKTGAILFFLKLFLLILAIFFKPSLFFYQVILLLEAVRFFHDLVSHQLRRPKITTRSMALTIFSFIFVAIIIFINYREINIKTLFFYDLASYFLLLIPLLLTSFLSKFILTIKRDKAISILKKHHPTVIAITGSYGKSSTKHLLFELLKSYSPTEKTPGNYNTNMGIIRSLNTLNFNTKYFICEMGAYKKNEIDNLCQIAKPDYAIITGITPQHLALFGNLDNLIRTKYEIAQNLKENGILFVNVSNSSTEPIISLAQTDKIKTITYALKQREDQKVDILALIIKRDKDKTTLKIKTPHFVMDFITNLTNFPELENLTGALAISLSLKIPAEHLKKAVINLPSIDSGFKIKTISPQLTIIDDFYNSNPVGFEAALRSLEEAKNFKVLITDGIQELGKASHLIHKNLAEKAKFADLILTTSPSLVKPFRLGLATNQNKLWLIKQNISLEKLKKLINTPTTILIEGRIPLQLANTVKKIN